MIALAVVAFRHFQTWLDEHHMSGENSEVVGVIMM